jgi:hypothetical protein
MYTGRASRLIVCLFLSWNAGVNMAATHHHHNISTLTTGGSLALASWNAERIQFIPAAYWSSVGNTISVQPIKIDTACLFSLLDLYH